MSTTSEISQEPSAVSGVMVMSSDCGALQTRPDKNSDFLSDLERQMKELWSQYVKCLDKDGLNETAKKLRNKYYNLYRCYRQNKEWKNLINSN